MHRLHRLLWLIVLALAALTLGIWASVYAESAPAQGKLEFAMLDIGQGDSLFIQSPAGEQVLVDGGPDASVLSQLPTVMPLLDRSLDAVIETHPDADHIAGLSDVLAHYQVEDFIEPGIDKSNATINKLESEVKSENLKHYTARSGMWLDLGGGAHLDILYPDWDVTHMDLDKDNDGGIVARLVYGQTSVLLMADTSTAVEDHLMQIATSSMLHSTILKVGHHGSKYSSDPAFVAEVAPQIALISVGAHNTYGHPAPQTLSTLSSLNIPILRTDQVGTIVCTSDGTKFICNK